MQTFHFLLIFLCITKMSKGQQEVLKEVLKGLNALKDLEIVDLGKAKFTIQEMTEISPLLLQEKRLDSLDYRTSNAGTSRRIRSFKAVVNQAVDATCTLMKEVVKVPQCGEQEVIGFLYPAKLKIDASSAHDSLIKQLISQNNLNHCHWLQCNLFCSGRYGNNILDFIMNQFQPPCWFEESLCIYCN